jgi:cytochrome c peroxidase
MQPLRVSGVAVTVLGAAFLSAGLLTTPTFARDGGRGGGDRDGGGDGGGRTEVVFTSPAPPTNLPSPPADPTSPTGPTGGLVGGGGDGVPATNVVAPAPLSGAPGLIGGGDGAGRGGGGGGNGLAPLSFVLPPQAGGGTIVNGTAAVALGKALFWDVQAGGDGRQACASCHYHAGEDARGFNTLNPGPDGRISAAGVTGPGQPAQPSNIVSDDRWGSQGVVAADFLGVDPNPTIAADMCAYANGGRGDAFFGLNRQVTGRNAPSVINAVFNRDNFWDGRANHVFNGFNPFGLTANNTDGQLLNMTNASLASQAVGPADNPVEMACAHRPFNGSNSLAAKMLARQPLQFQQVSPNDSVLGSLANVGGTGLNITYGELVSAAFGPVDASANFSAIWGQAVQAYESTLISNQTPLDRYLSGNRFALSPSQQVGLNVFEGKGHCTECHAGPELTDAAVDFYARNGPRNRDGGDQGFHNIGVRPTSEDLGHAGAGPNGASYSVSGSFFDRGAFKTPALRNVGLRAPYFHNGGKATLVDVIGFYARGGDFANPEKSRELKPISLSASDVGALVDFLQNGLTDCRVAVDAAPFDHPSLPLNGAADVPATGGFASC